MTAVERQDHEDFITITELLPRMRKLNLRFKVVSIRSPRQVFSRQTGKKLLVAEAIVGDQTGIITLVLWNDDVDELNVGETYHLRNGRVTIFEECMQLSIGRDGDITLSEEPIEEIKDSNDMSKPFAARPKKKGKKRSTKGKSLSGVQGREAKGYCTWKGF